MGEVHIEKFRTIRIYLSNLTPVTAKWQLNYVEFPKKSTIGYKTTTPWEVENMDKKDDPDVFEFQHTEVSTGLIFRAVSKAGVFPCAWPPKA